MAADSSLADSPPPKTVVLELSPGLESDLSLISPEPSKSGAPESAEQNVADRSNLNGSGTPPGTGPLYKCAICGEFVYESQLEHHVLVCPDPAESTVATNAKTQARRGAPQAPAAVDQNKHDEGLPESLLMSSASEATQRMWSQWKEICPDSELAAHHEAMVKRSLLRKQQLIDELRQKEEQECTFQPKTLPRGSPRTYSRPDTTGEGKWIARWDQRMRNQKLKQVEAQAYAELTLKPKISPYAQAWSQKQAEVAADGQAPLSVFERLYHAALVQEIKKENAVQESYCQVEADCQVSITSSGLHRQPPARRVPTSELLYSDALDRRERLRIMAEQIQIRREEESKEKRQVLSRSRRYYWQILERQIKAAFEETTKGEPFLLQALLEDFLMNFRCMRPRRTDTEVPNSEDADSSRLVAALWRHLDPNKTGQTDLLTMTVFFHVLMGAVDDAVRASQTIGLVPVTEEEETLSPSKMSPRALSPRSGGEGSSPLAAINEETAATAPAVDTKALLGEAGLAVALASDDEQGRRIVELLLRFNPVRLRAEFQPLYSHRMHYQAQQEKKKEPEKDEQQVMDPKIDSQSRIMAAKLMQRQRGECGKEKVTHADILLWRHQQVQEKKEKLRKKAECEEVSHCPFRPNVFQPPSRRTAESQADITTPRGVSRAEVLYARGIAEKEKKELKALEGEKQKAGAEIRDCTFRPNTSQSVRSYHRSHESQTSVPRGFYESRQRLRAANEVRGQRYQQKEDRMAKLLPTTPYHEVHSLLGPSGGTSVPSSPLPRGSSPPRGALDTSTASALSTLAEDQSGIRRRSASPKSAGLGSNLRQRAASIRNGVPASSSRGATGRRTSEEAGASRPRSQPAGRAKTSQRPADKEVISTEPTPDEAATPSVSSRPGGLLQGNPGTGVPNFGNPEAEDVQELPAPVLFVDVNITPGQPPERIVLREGHSVNEVAAEFAAKHMLTPVLAQRLHTLLKEVVQRQEQQQGIQQPQQ